MDDKKFKDLIQRICNLLIGVSFTKEQAIEIRNCILPFLMRVENGKR